MFWKKKPKQAEQQAAPSGHSKLTPLVEKAFSALAGRYPWAWDELPLAVRFRIPGTGNIGEVRLVKDLNTAGKLYVEVQAYRDGYDMVFSYSLFNAVPEEVLDWLGSEEGREKACAGLIDLSDSVDDRM